MGSLDHGISTTTSPIEETGQDRLSKFRNHKACIDVPLVNLAHLDDKCKSEDLSNIVDNKISSPTTASPISSLTREGSDIEPSGSHDQQEYGLCHQETNPDVERNILHQVEQKEREQEAKGDKRQDGCKMTEETSQVEHQ